MFPVVRQATLLICMVNHKRSSGLTNFSQTTGCCLPAQTGISGTQASKHLLDDFLKHRPLPAPQPLTLGCTFCLVLLCLSLTLGIRLGLTILLLHCLLLLWRGETDTKINQAPLSTCRQQPRTEITPGTVEQSQ